MVVILEARRPLGYLSTSQFLILLPAVGLMALAVLVFAGTWSAMLTSLSKKDEGWMRFTGVFLITWPSRYVPGTLPYHAARVLLTSRMNVPKGNAVGAIGYEAILQIGAAVFVGTLCLVLAAGDSLSAGVPYLVLLGMGACPLLLLRRTVFHVAANRILRFARRQPLAPDAMLGDRLLALAFLAYAGATVLNGAAFFLILGALSGGMPNPLLAIAAFSLGGAAGVAVIFLPGGLGVREAAIVAVLALSTDPGSTALAAAVARAVSIVADLLPLSALMVARLASRATRSSVAGPLS
jgi:uncharacterized membrane protein YbhN (UPF0104 family)